MDTKKERNIEIVSIFLSRTFYYYFANRVQNNDGRKTDPMMVGKPTPNKTNINNLIENQTMRASGEPPTAYGRYENIFLSKDEYDELQAEYPDRLERLIEEMSHYLAASGKAYQNYAAALHRWAANDKKGAVKQGIPDYTCMEGESL